VEALIAGWELRDPNPEAYTTVLDAMARAAPIFGSQDEEVAALTGARRLVEMALELDAWGPTVAKAVSDVVDQGQVDRLLGMLSQVDRDQDVAARIRSYLVAPENFRRFASHIDESGMAALIDEMRDRAIDPLLDVLAESDDRSVRRRIFDALARMGPTVVERTGERLGDSRWFVLRNMLALLVRLQRVPEGFDPQPFTEHADPRVRREAFPLAVAVPRLRDRALVASLTDRDERMVRMALLELQKEVPDPVLPTLVNRVVAAEERSAEIRALGVRALAETPSPLALNTLLDLVSAGKSLFGKARLGAATPEILQALRVLAVRWSDRPEVRDVLELAARSKDPKIRHAATRPVGPAAKEHRS
jgi:hypothetical protein